MAVLLARQPPERAAFQRSAVKKARPDPPMDEARPWEGPDREVLAERLEQSAVFRQEPQACLGLLLLAERGQGG